jgi:hypothetical protein
VYVYFEFEEGYGMAKQGTFMAAKGRWVAKLIVRLLAYGKSLPSPDISQKL